MSKIYHLPILLTLDAKVCFIPICLPTIQSHADLIILELKMIVDIHKLKPNPSRSPEPSTGTQEHENVERFQKSLSCKPIAGRLKEYLYL